MTNPVTPLASQFTAASSADWIALVEKTLKGSGVDTLVRRSVDGLPIKPLYTQEGAAEPMALSRAPRSGAPAWDIRAMIAADAPAEANRQALDALAGGASSILTRFTSDDDLARTLDGVLTDVAPVALDAGFQGPAAARALAAIAKASPIAPLALHMDPLTSFAERGVSPGPIEGHLQAAATAAVTVAGPYPRATLFIATGIPAHEAGGSPAWELALAMASAVAYAKALVEAGLSMDEAFARIVLGLAADAKPLEAITKMRAARALWTRVTGACGVTRPALIEARSSRRMLTRADRWTNLIRLTSAGFGAAVGGADAVALGAFTDAVSPPDAFALRIARNTQLVLMEEAYLGRVADPAGGSWAVEDLTLELAKAAWAAFTGIEAAGGAIAALRAGVVAKAVEGSCAALRGAIAQKELRVIGVTDFRGEDPPSERAPEIPRDALERARLPGADSECPPLTAIRLEDLV